MKYTSIILPIVFAASAALPVLAQHTDGGKAKRHAASVIWFDKPTSLQGQAIWTKSPVPEGFDGPVNAGEGHVNPDPEWEQRSLPIGNGSIGANILGSIPVERITLNEKTLWRGGPGTGEDADKGTARGAMHYWNQNKQSAHLLPEIRQAFTDGDWNKAAELTQNNFNSDVPYESTGEKSFRFGSFTTMGELCITTGIDSASARNYRRELAVDSALATVSFDADGVRYERRSFVSYPDNALVMRFSANKKGRQNLGLAYTANPLGKGSFEADGKGGFVYNAKLDNNGMAYTVRVKAIAKGGKVTADGGKINVSGADEVVFLLTADTDYKPNYNPRPDDPKAYVGVDPQKTTGQWMARAASKGYERLLKDHEADYQALFNRVKFSLAGNYSDAPTGVRLADYRKGKEDRALETLYYQFGRYLLISSSRPGNLPANLQGIWHNNVDGPWRVDYHNNINLQMNYWPALTTGLAECAEPLTDFINMLRKPGERTARDYWGARGWAAGISANIFGFTAPLEGQDMTWNYNPMAASWLTTHLWEYYDFTRNETFLREQAYPVLKECAEFTVDFLWQRPDGLYTAAPSTSPEHGPVDEGTTFTHAVAREILGEAIHAAAILGIDAQEASQWQHVLDNIVPYKIGRYGQLLEWSRDIDDPNDHHRHVNHLFGLHPGSTISPLTTTELARAARVVLEHRGDGATGWSMGWKLNQWARLHDGNHSYLLYGNLLKNGTSDNLWDTHPPFQIDGNFGGTAGVTEMLLQSHAGCIDLLPALPDAWAEGSISGLGARGNFTVSIDWRGGKLDKAVIKSGNGGECSVRCGKSTLRFDTKKGRSYNVTLENGMLKAEEI